MASVRDSRRAAGRWATISPARQLANVADALVALAARRPFDLATRRPFDGQLDEIRAVAAQLKELADRHAAGELPALEDDGSPF
jgi:hypothetical protein